MEQIVNYFINIILKLIDPILSILKWIYNKLPFEVRCKKRKPKLGIIENSFKGHTWELSKSKDEEFLIIQTNWHITNTLPYNLTVLNTFLVRPQRVKGSWMAKDTKSNYWGTYGIPKGYTTDVNLSYKINSKYVKGPDSTLSVTLSVIDPIGNKHTVKNVKIKPITTKRSKSPEEEFSLENPNQIHSPVEKIVVAVLKDEIEQYKVRGRREGRLGTVEWPRGTIEWRAQGEKIEFLYENSARDLVKSQNSSTLVTLYNNVSEEDKKVILKALNKRINRQTEYRDVGYIILLTLFELRMLPQGLKAALKNLENDGKHGFSDTLRLLDLLLAFRYKEFSENDLDILEKVTFSTSDHTFKIKQRVNAIRIKRSIN